MVSTAEFNRLKQQYEELKQKFEDLKLKIKLQESVKKEPDISEKKNEY